VSELYDELERLGLRASRSQLEALLTHGRVERALEPHHDRRELPELLRDARWPGSPGVAEREDAAVERGISRSHPSICAAAARTTGSPPSSTLPPSSWKNQKASRSACCRNGEILTGPPASSVAETWRPSHGG
jgi:hypothetical protein